MSIANTLKQNPFQRSNPFNAQSSLNYKNISTNINSNSSQLHKPLQQNYLNNVSHNNINNGYNNIYSNSNQSIVNSLPSSSYNHKYQYQTGATNSHTNTQHIPLSIKQNNYLQKYKIQDSMWKFSQDNCNKNKLFVHQNYNNNNVVRATVEKNLFQKQILLSNIKKRQHSTSGTNYQNDKDQKIVQNPFNRKYLVTSNVNNQLAESIVYAPNTTTNKFQANNQNNNDVKPVSNMNLRSQKQIYSTQPQYGSYRNVQINYDYDNPKIGYNYQYGNTKKNIQNLNGYSNYLYKNNIQSDSPSKSIYNDNSMRLLKNFQSNYDVQSPNIRHQEIYASSKNVSSLPPPYPNGSFKNIDKQKDQAKLQRTSKVSRGSRQSRRTVQYQKQIGKVMFGQSQSQQQTPRINNSDVRRVILSKQDIEHFQQGPETLIINGKTFYKQQLIPLF